MEETKQKDVIVVETQYDPQRGNYTASLCNGVHPQYSPLPWLASIREYTEDEFDEAVRKRLAENPPDKSVRIKHYGWETLIECTDPSAAMPRPALSGPALV